MLTPHRGGEIWRSQIDWWQVNRGLHPNARRVRCWRSASLNTGQSFAL
jgi:hypothetical protein